MSTAELPAPDPEFSPSELDAFTRDGCLVVRNLAPRRLVERMREVTRDGLARRIEPIEYEAELHYPGAPESRSAEGGGTPRRLKQALTRDYVFLEWLQYAPLLNRLRQLLGPRVVCPLAHHNCIMTKEPRYSSDTGWHQDIRYWAFQRPELVNVWLALGSERPENGCLRVIPGSHRLSYAPSQFDEALFLRSDLPANAPLLAREQPVPLEAGDVLFFHCLTFHAASRNATRDSKQSVVFTFRPADNPPTPGSRSAEWPELALP